MNQPPPPGDIVYAPSRLGTNGTNGWTCSSCGRFVANFESHCCNWVMQKYLETRAADFNGFLLPTQTGWLCPRCGVVNAPSVERCSCPAPSSYSSGTSTL